jgi:hypothetical protein
LTLKPVAEKLEELLSRFVLAQMGPVCPKWSLQEVPFALCFCAPFASLKADLLWPMLMTSK